MNEPDLNRKYKIKINSPEKERIKEISKIFSERLEENTSWEQKKRIAYQVLHFEIMQDILKTQDTREVGYILMKYDEWFWNCGGRSRRGVDEELTIAYSQVRKDLYNFFLRISE